MPNTPEEKLHLLTQMVKQTVSSMAALEHMTDYVNGRVKEIRQVKLTAIQNRMMPDVSGPVEARPTGINWHGVAYDQYGIPNSQLVDSPDLGETLRLFNFPEFQGGDQIVVTVEVVRRAKRGSEDET